MTFIPLETIKVKEVNESNRRLGGSFKLVIDVVEFDDSIKKALLYACGNTLLCDTLGEARKLCYGSSGDKKYKVVALDGTAISKSGNLSGGKGDFARKASQWDEKDMTKVTQRKERLLHELVDIGKLAGAGNKEQSLSTEISGLKSRKHFSELDLKQTAEKLKKSTADVAAIDKELAAKKPEKAKLAKVLKTKEAGMDEVAAQQAAIRAELFADFAESVGVADIAQYEDNRLKTAQATMERRQALAEQQSRLKSQLEYERERDLAAPLAEAEKKMAETVSTLAGLEKEAKAASADMAGQRKEVDQLEAELTTSQKGVEEHTKKWKALKKSGGDEMKAVSTLEKKLAQKETLVEQLKDMKKHLIQQATIEQVATSFFSSSLDSFLISSLLRCLSTYSAYRHRSISTPSSTPFRSPFY
jgi:structural maintenance of chromosome 1